MLSPRLSEIQSWLMTVMTAPGGVGQGLSLAKGRLGLDSHDVVLRHAGASSEARLHIYANGYVLRLLECLRADFPVLQRVMGDDLFTFFAKAYIWQHPSESTTLFDLGAGFPDFLLNSQPKQVADTAASFFQFPIELARLERVRTEVIRAPGLEKRMDRTDVSVFDILLNPSLQVTLAPCTRLLKLSFPLIEFWEQAEANDEGIPGFPDACESERYVAIARLKYRVSMYSLLPWQYHFLTAAQSSQSIQQCAHYSAEQSGLAKEWITSEWLLWFPVAMGIGLLTLECQPK